MTGYGKATVTYKDKKINVEVKSLNCKALDISVRTAPLYREKEMEIRQMIAQAAVRGKIDFSISVEREAAAGSASVNAELIESYYLQLKDITAGIGIPEPQDWLPVLLRMPDVTVKNEIEVLDDEEWAAARGAIGEALLALAAFRVQEGQALRLKFDEKLNNIAALLSGIEPYEKARVEKIKARITEGLKAIPDVEYDTGRLEQELIYYIEKLDISEEKQRLANHLRYFRETLDEDAGQGKKLGFIAQEMGREINTTGSKSNNAEMQNLVVKMKDELEQIKEQVLNVL